MGPDEETHPPAVRGSRPEAGRAVDPGGRSARCQASNISASTANGSSNSRFSQRTRRPGRPARRAARRMSRGCHRPFPRTQVEGAAAGAMRSGEADAHGAVGPAAIWGEPGMALAHTCPPRDPASLAAKPRPALPTLQSSPMIGPFPPGKAWCGESPSVSRSCPARPTCSCAPMDMPLDTWPRRRYRAGRWDHPAPAGPIRSAACLDREGR